MHSSPEGAVATAPSFHQPPLLQPIHGHQEQQQRAQQQQQQPPSLPQRQELARPSPATIPAATPILSISPMQMQPLPAEQPMSTSVPTTTTQTHAGQGSTTTSPGNTFADDQYDSDAEAELDLASRETLHEGQILKAGYLMKKGERLKEYELLRIIDVRDIHRAAEAGSKSKVGVFMILTPRRTFTVQADSVADMHTWIQTINQAKVHCDLSSSSDIDSNSGSTPQLDSHQTLLPRTQGQTQGQAQGQAQGQGQPQPGMSPKTELVKQGSGTLVVPQRRPPNQLSFSDPGLVLSTNIGGGGEGIGVGDLHGSGPMSLSPSALSPSSRHPDPVKTSGLTIGLSSPTTSPARNSMRALQSGDNGLSLITTGTQAVRIGGCATPTSPPRDGNIFQQPPQTPNQHGPAELPPNSYSSNYSHNGNHMMHAAPGTPSSPGYGSGGEQYCCPGGEHVGSSEEEEIVDDPHSVLEAGRVAVAANAPGSGLVTDEQIGSKVVRQGYLVKLGNTYKTWRKKWFVLRGDKLTYYKNSKEYQPLGIIPLSSIIDCLQIDPVSKSKLYCMRIVTLKRNFVCCAPDEDTLLQWLDALHVECTRAKREAKRQEEDDENEYAGDEEDILSSPRATGRTAQLKQKQQQQNSSGVMPTTTTVTVPAMSTGASIPQAPAAVATGGHAHAPMPTVRFLDQPRPTVAAAVTGAGAATTTTLA
ncbi:hypothetical protein BGW38_000556 [Lunasporangiospora selenospora]|uniref:PH domain-containing protein n=1 Tax=Lunasporangiospora selenospora TaxID=979761 RepID=A0A9P6FUN5_9FUNG|nr:hypothetical protein BGW38_000556 [Lunasporangiospora selenospora]